MQHQPLKLGRAARRILLTAANGPFSIAAGTQSLSQRIGRHHAARRLEAHGLVRRFTAPGKNRTGATNWRLSSVELTTAGRAVLHAFAHEIEHGGRIRMTLPNHLRLYSNKDTRDQTARLGTVENLVPFAVRFTE
jgi:hypothetical protein